MALLDLFVWDKVGGVGRLAGASYALKFNSENQTNFLFFFDHFYGLVL